MTAREDRTSKKGGLKFRLESGPKGMMLSETGEVTWAVPDDETANEVKVIVSIRDTAGRECLHMFSPKLE